MNTLLHGVEAGGDVTITSITIHQPVSAMPVGRLVVGGIPQVPAFFVARTELGLLREVLRRSPVAVVVTGMRGVGKTHLAAALAREVNATGAGLVGWINAESIGTAREGLAEIADRYGVGDPDHDPAVSAVRLRDFLSGRPETGLLVFDNATDPDAIRELLPTGGGTRVIVTSTNRAFTALGEPLDLGGFTRAESVAFLREATSSADDGGADVIAEMLGDLPLALSAAAATIIGRHVDYQRYRRLLGEQPLPRVLARREGHDYRLSVTQAIVLSVDTAEAASGDPELEGEVRWLLGLMAMLAPAGVSRLVLPDRIGRVDEAVDRCVTGALMSWSTAGDMVIMHRLVARVLRERALSADTASELVAGALDVLASHLFEPSQAWAQRVWGNHLVDQIDAVWEAGLLSLTSDRALVETALLMRIWAGEQLHRSVDLTRALANTLATLTDCEQLLGPDHPVTLNSRNNLAGVYGSVGRLDEAIQLYEATLTDREQLLGPDDPLTLTTRNNLAGAHKSAGRLDKAIPLYETALHDRARVLGSDHPHTLTSRNDLAHAYESAGQLDKAVLLYEATFIDCERVLGSDDPLTLTTRNNLAYTYGSAGRLDEAIPLYEATLTDRERVLGSDHPDTLSSRNNLACAYGSAGRLDEAIQLYETALHDCERVLGSDHPLTLTTRHNLAGAYESAGRLDEAIQLYEATLHDRERVLGSDHPDTLGTRNNLAYTYESAGRLDEAIQLYGATLTDCERVLGPDHPLTATARGNVANVGRLQQRNQGGQPAD